MGQAPPMSYSFCNPNQVFWLRLAALIVVLTILFVIESTCLAWIGWVMGASVAQAADNARKDVRTPLVNAAGGIIPTAFAPFTNRLRKTDDPTLSRRNGTVPYWPVGYNADEFRAANGLGPADADADAAEEGRGRGGQRSQSSRSAASVAPQRYAPETDVEKSGGRFSLNGYGKV